EKIVFALLARLQDPPLPAIAGLLADEKHSEPDRLRAARALASFAQPEARRVLLAAVASREPEQVPAAIDILHATLQSRAGFEEQARAIQGLGMLHNPAATASLADFRARAADSVLRYFATREMASLSDPEAGLALRAALLDNDPRARETAAFSLGQRHDQAMAQPIIDAAKQEPWPGVRRAEVTALGELCVPEGNDLLLRAYEKDEND